MSKLSSFSEGLRFSFDSQAVLAAVTDRNGGVSQGQLASLNLCFKQADQSKRVLDNRQIAAKSLGFNFEDMVVPEQVHGLGVTVVKSQDRGCGADSAASSLAGCDALITNQPMIPLAVMVADCAPVILYDPNRLAVGIAHAGWRGAAGRIVSQTIKAMTKEFDCQPADIWVGIGPCLQAFSLEVSTDVAKQVEAQFVQQPAVHYDLGDKPHLDIPFMVKQQVLDTGVHLSHIEDMRLDTLTNQRFFSHRRQAGQAGRFMGIVMLRINSTA